MAQMQCGQFIHAVAMAASVQDIGHQHGVVQRRDHDPVSSKHHHVVFQVMADFEHRGIGEEWAQQIERRVEWNLAERFPLSRGRLLTGGWRNLRCGHGLGKPVCEGDVARVAGLHAQGKTDQIRKAFIQRRGFGIDRDGAGVAGSGHPVLQDLSGLDQLIAGGGRSLFGLGRGFPGRQPALDFGDDRPEALFIEERDQLCRLRVLAE